MWDMSGCYKDLCRVSIAIFNRRWMGHADVKQSRTNTKPQANCFIRLMLDY